MFESLIPKDTNPPEARERIKKVIEKYNEWLEGIRWDLDVDTDAYVSWERDIGNFTANVSRVIEILDDSELLVYERMFEYIHDTTDPSFKTLSVGEFSESLLGKLNQIEKSKRKEFLANLESRLKSDVKINIFDENYDANVKKANAGKPALNYYDSERIMG